MKKSIITILILALSLLAISLCATHCLTDDGDRIASFIKAHPEKSAIVLIKNDEVIVSQNANKMMPLASTMKIIIAIEYAYQAAAGDINSEEMVPLSALDAYYVPNTDGNAHPAWLNSVSEMIKEQQIALHEIVKGMILYSSNANTDWLIGKLGIERINQRIGALELDSHSPVFPIVAALFASKTLAEKGKASSKQDLMQLPDEAYHALCLSIHQKMSVEPSYSKNLGDLSIDYQRVWSDRLPASTVADYASLMAKLNSKTYFPEEVDLYLSDVLEYIMKNPANAQWLKHSGMKGGSTAFVLTKAMYATLKNGDKVELAYFFNDLTMMENMQLQMSMNDFELKVLSDHAFTEQLKAMF